jgi:hypothetical protein
LAPGALDLVLGLRRRKRVVTCQRVSIFYFIFHTYILHRRTARTCQRGWHICAGRLRGPSSPPRHVGRIFVVSILNSLSVHTHTFVLSVYLQLDQRGSRMLTKSVRWDARTAEPMPWTYRVRLQQTCPPPLDLGSCPGSIYD